MSARETNRATLDAAIYRLGLALNQRMLMPARAAAEIEDALSILREIREAQGPAQ